MVIAILELLDEPRDAPLDAVVTEEHHKAIIAEEGVGDFDGVG